MLELIKDGRVTASRYSSKVLRLQTPSNRINFPRPNDARSGQADLQYYDVLKLNIKDGRVTASRYSSKVLRLQTPNVVVIFSKA